MQLSQVEELLTLVRDAIDNNADSWKSPDYNEGVFDSVQIMDGLLEQLADDGPECLDELLVE